MLYPSMLVELEPGLRGHLVMQVREGPGAHQSPQGGGIVHYGSRARRKTLAELHWPSKSDQ